LRAGDKVGRYELVSRVGKGGMGEVWRARDTQLDRTVAIKFSREPLSERFRLEAWTAAQLSHPNICTLHDVGANYLVMEFVDGEPLRGPMLPAKALAFATQICDALEAAHRRGIVHRDLKPSNILAGKQGIKLLDFGLAKLKEGAPGPPELSDTLTGERMFVGTPQYMAPEQLHGKPADARSDIFALGCVLYEMLTGARAFEGETTASVIASVLTKEPRAVSEFQPLAPPLLEGVLAKCLAKDPEGRWQTARDLRHALELAAASPAPAVQVRGGRWWPWVLAASVIITAGATWFAARRGNDASAVIVRPLTTMPGDEMTPAISPDGRMVAYVWDPREGEAVDLYVRLIDRGAPLRLTSDRDAETTPVWSPDSQRIAYVRFAEGRQATIYEVPALGGGERRIGAGRAYAWSPDGNWLLAGDGVSGTFLTASSLKLVSVQDGETRPLPQPPIGQVDGAVFLDAQTILAIGNEKPGQVSLCRLSLGQRLWSARRITGVAAGGTLALGPGGDEIVFDAPIRAGQPRRLARAPAEGGEAAALSFGMNGTWPSISRTGDRMVFESNFENANIYRVAAWPGLGGGQKPERWISGPAVEDSPAISPDGARIAVSSTRAGQSQIWLSHIDGSNPRPLTNLIGGTVGSPVWSPDGKMIAFDARLEGNPDVWVAPADGGAPKRLTDDRAEDVLPCWSPDGKYIFFSSRRAGEPRLFRVPAAGGAAEPWSKGEARAARLSRDGKYTYFLRSGAGGGLWRMPAGGGEEEFVLAEVNHRNFIPLADGVYFFRILRTSGAQGRAGAGEACFYRFSARKVEKLGFTTTRPMRQNSIGMSPDGQWIFFVQVDSQGRDLMLVENFR
jgi:Tol biopolymer transport system component/predicted Ser/Thr protein kinase